MLNNGKIIGIMKKILLMASNFGIVISNGFKSLFLYIAVNHNPSKKISKQINIGQSDKGLSVIPNAGNVQLTANPANMMKAIDNPTV